MNSGDTAWVLISAALVFIMTPSVALFYGGMVRSKNVLSTIMQAMFILGMVSVEFILIGYTMAFGADVNGLIGDLSKIGLSGIGYNLLDGETAFFISQITPVIESLSINVFKNTSF